MTKIYSTILTLASIIAQAQVPTNGLVFRQEFNGNFTDQSSTNAIASFNTSTLTTDVFNLPNQAASFQTGQYIRYPFSTYGSLMAGSNSKELSITCDVKLDSAYFENLPTPTQYINVVKNGECFIRFRKSGSGATKILYIQAGVFNNGAINYGYQENIYQLKDYTSPLTQDTINYKHNTWNNFAFRYYQGGVNLTPTIELFVNGVLLHGASEATYTNMPVSYNSSTEGLVIGQPTGVLHQSFQGKIDNVYIYDRKLTDTEFANIAVNTFYSSIKDSEQNNVFSFYPNPANEVLNVELENLNEAVTVSIINALREEVLIGKEAIQHSTFNIQHLTSGVYFIKIESKKGTTTKKFIKQ